MPNCKGTKFSSTKGNNNGRPPKIISFCPECLGGPNAYQADPEKSPNTPAASARIGKCKYGHAWLVGGASYAGERVALTVS